MEIGDLELHLREAAKKIEEIGHQYAIAKGASWTLQEQKKVILAKVMKRHSHLKIAEQEREAYDSPEYDLHLEGCKEAITSELKLKASYEKWKAQFEACRSMYSAYKATLKSFQEED